MYKFLVRRFLYLIITMFLASIAVFAAIQLTPVDLANKVLGQFATPDQKQRWKERNGLNQPAFVRYVDWLVGNDWQISRMFDPSRIQGLIGIADPTTGDTEWWAQSVDGSLLQWKMVEGELIQIRLTRLGEAGEILLSKKGDTYLCTGVNCSQVTDEGTVQPAISRAEISAECDPDEGCQTCKPGSCYKDDNLYRRLSVICHKNVCWLGEAQQTPAGEDIWKLDEAGTPYFWGVDNDNHAVKWVKGVKVDVSLTVSAGREQSEESGGVEYRPLQRGLLRGDPGISFLTGRPVAKILPTRIRNSLTLAGIAFIIIMPLALVCGVIAGLNEGRGLDRLISISGLATTATPEFTIGALLLYFFVIRFESGLPGAVTLMPGEVLLDHPEMLVLPVLTLSMAELGYVIRMTRASVVEVMSSPYIRTAFLKGLPKRRIILKHVLRNALMAPITVIMLHVNWLVGGIVVVEALFGFPGVGSFLLSAALFGDLFAIEAGAMFMVVLAVSTQMIADIAYTFLNPRIRFS
jgi:peptide/nickel transport system permease protein